jgi:ADP-heptose:LPS heptosyltransferase
MLRGIRKKFFKSPFDLILKRAKKRGMKKFLFVWNRGLGDIPLGLYPMVRKIREEILDAEITFLIRGDLKEGFLLFKDVRAIVVDSLKRGEKYRGRKILREKNFLKKDFDVFIKKPNPAFWVREDWEKIIPKLSFDKKFDNLYKKFNLKEEKVYLGVQTHSDTNHSNWRDWPEKRWEEFFGELQKRRVKVLLFGVNRKKIFPFKNIVDLRGKTTLLEMISIVKNLCSHMVLPDGGILSVLYYLDVFFKIRIVSLWGDSQGVLKRGINSPNRGLEHIPIFLKGRNLMKIEVLEVLRRLFGS